jgi:hypothetical protein
MNIRQLQGDSEKLPQWQTVLIVSLVGTVVTLLCAWGIAELFMIQWRKRMSRLNKIDTTNRHEILKTTGYFDVRAMPRNETDAIFLNEIRSNGPVGSLPTRDLEENRKFEFFKHAGSRRVKHGPSNRAMFSRVTKMGRSIGF